MEAQSPEQTLVTRKWQLSKPAVLRSADGAFLSVGNRYGGRVDATVFHPHEALVSDRPDWMSMNGYRQAVPLAGEVVPARGRWLVQAFRTKEEPEAVPVDQVLVEPGGSVPVSMLPPGRYRLVT